MQKNTTESAESMPTAPSSPPARQRSRRKLFTALLLVLFAVVFFASPFLTRL